MISFLKYSINIFVMLFVAWQIVMSFTMIIQFPTCDVVLVVIWQQGLNVAIVAIPSFVFVTAVNILINAKLEKQERSRETWFLLFIHVAIQLGIFLYLAFELKKYCKEF